VRRVTQQGRGAPAAPQAATQGLGVRRLLAPPGFAAPVWQLARHSLARHGLAYQSGVPWSGTRMHAACAWAGPHYMRAGGCVGAVV
jgi:hypothetical protein